MADRTIIYEKSNILQKEVMNANFICTESDGLLFTPNTNTDEITPAVAVNTHYPTETDMPHWNSVNYNWTRSTLINPPIYKAIVSLIGINPDGTEHLIGEDIITTIGTTVTETRGFDLRQSAAFPPLNPVTGTCAAGNIQINLPFRYEHFESITAELCTLWQNGTVTAGWTVVAGTRAVEQPFNDNDNWVKHTGNGSDALGSNIIYTANASSNYIARFDYASGVSGGSNVGLFYPRYANSTNYLVVRTYWNGTTQYIQFLKVYGGVTTTYASVAWLDHCLPLLEVHDFKIIDNGTHITVKIDDVTYIDVDYNPQMSATSKGHGSNGGNIGYWNIMQVREIINPTTPDNEDLSILFPTPTGFAENSPVKLNYKEYENAEYPTAEATMSSRGIAKMGYNSLDAFSALRLKFEIFADSDYNTQINNVIYRYEV